MTPLAMLWAAGWADMIGIVVVILFFVIPIIGQMFAKMRQPQKPDPGRGPRPGGGPPGQAMEDEIGDFLRRAMKRGGAEQARPRPRPVERPPLAQLAEPQQPLEAEVVRDAPLGSGVKKHVGQYLDSGEFQRRTSQLGDEVAQADEHVEKHLHEVFDHQLGQVANIPGESALPSRAGPLTPERLPPTAAAGLPVLLSNAENIRQAIIITEILQRPEHRWT